MPAVSVKPAVNAITLSARPDLTLTARQQRQHDPDFLARCDIAALVGQLPLRWPTPPQVPASPKPRYRSDYQPPDPARVQQLDEAAWQSISLFDLLLLLVDFSGLRPVLASKLYRTSARGRIPFDPISCFLLFGWQLVNCWKRLEVLRQLAKPRNGDYREAFGFRSGVYPSESGYRYFVTVLGQKPLGELIRQSMELVRATGAVPAEVLAQATVSFDGQIHDAASHQRCHQVQASCYQPTPTRQTSSPQGEGRYGYRSLPAQLVAPTWGVNWTLDEAELAPANTHEESLAGDLLRRVVGEYFWLRVTTAVGDAGLGYGPFLGVYLPTTPPHSLRIPNR